MKLICLILLLPLLLVLLQTVRDIDCDQEDEDRELAFRNRIESIRGNPYFERCWSLPRVPNLEEESTDDFERRLQQCQLYYKLIVARRFLRWGTKIGKTIHRWLQMINEELEVDPMRTIRIMLTEDLNRIPSLRSKLIESFVGLDLNQIPIDNDMIFIRSRLKLDFERGYGVCFDMNSPPMDRLFQLLNGMTASILDQNRLRSQFMETYLTQRDRQNRLPILLRIYLLQVICKGLSNFHFDESIEGIITFSNNLAPPENLNSLLLNWRYRVLFGSCNMLDLFIFGLIQDSSQISLDELPEEITRYVDEISDLLVCNCMKYMRIAFDQNHLDILPNGIESFRFYKTAMLFLHLCKRIALRDNHSSLNMLDIRSNDRYEEIDRFFLEYNDPYLVDAYTRGGGICETYKNLNDTTLLWVVWKGIVNRIIGAKHTQLRLSYRTLAWYLVKLVCEQARIIPIDIPAQWNVD